ncbi:MAG: PilX N-terminal domain-containing pilus assembly protein [Gammaproteobacteria bacterium]|nr:PilX N-terminal domain-containing pilus assembly protein [Gammaproteobacteria bacterium]
MSHSGPPLQQRGAILIFCLIFLLVLTLMGTAGMQSAVLQERMAGNMLSHDSARHAAEATLQEAQQWLAAQLTRPLADSVGSAGVWSRDSVDPDSSNTVPWWDEPDCLTSEWWQRHAREAREVQPPAQSYFLIEEFANVVDSQIYSYRITVRGTGLSEPVSLLLRSVVVRSYPNE